MHQLSLAGPEPDTMEILTLLLAHDADPLARGVQGHSALDLARSYRCEAVIRFLNNVPTPRRNA
jgi:ankyrin repeat protein